MIASTLRMLLWCAMVSGLSCEYAGGELCGHSHSGMGHMMASTLRMLLWCAMVSGLVVDMSVGGCVVTVTVVWGT